MESTECQAEATSNGSDGLLEEQERLAELQLLTRAEHHAPAGSTVSLSEAGSVLAVDGTTNSETEEVAGVLVPGEKRAVTTKSSFSAILTASRHLAVSQPSTSDPDTTAHGCNSCDKSVEATVVSFSRMSTPLIVANQGQLDSGAGRSLPTLSESGEGEEEDEAEKVEEMVPNHAYCSGTTNYDAGLSNLDEEQQNVRQAQTADEDDRGDGGSDEGAFREMLARVSSDDGRSLRLELGDLTVNKLERTREALSESHQASGSATMPHVRTRVAVDMLRLLAQRLGTHAVREAVGKVSSSMVQWGDASNGLEPIIVLTESNISAVVLKARRALMGGGASEPPDAAPSYFASLSPRSNISSSGNNNNHREHSISPTRQARRASVSPTSSPRARTSRQMPSDRRSILARDGAHVLMKEKLSAFDYRGRTPAPIPFRVRGDSAATAESAAQRRQRALQYANDHTTQRTVV